MRWVLPATVMIVVIGFVRSAPGQIVVSHPPGQAGGSPGDTFFYTDFGQPYSQQVADDFSIAGGATIRQVNWWGFYNANSFPTASPELMRLRFYGDADGVPGALLYDETFANPVRTFTGRGVVTGDGGAEYKYTQALSQPVSFAPGSLYWLEIVQLGDLPSHFRWESGGLEFNGFAATSTDYPNWIRIALHEDLAFELSTVPEPASGAVVVLALVISLMRISRTWAV